MPFDPRDITETLEAKVDQIIADDLLDRTITARIASVTAGPSKQQPMNVNLEGWPRPWRPCLTMRRVLRGLWTKDATTWKGHWVRLYRDPSARSPDTGKPVGGVRMSHADIDRKVSVSVTMTRGKKGDWVIMPLPKETARPTADLDEVLGNAELTITDVNRWRKSKNKGPVSELSDEHRALLGGLLFTNNAVVETIRGMIPLEYEDETGGDGEPEEGSA